MRIETVYRTTGREVSCVLSDAERILFLRDSRRRAALVQVLSLEAQERESGIWVVSETREVLDHVARE